MIIYTPFWETLRKSGETTYTLITKYHISSAILDKLTIKVPLPFRRREAKTAFLCGFARLLCAKPAFLAGLCASSKLPTFINGGAV